MLHQAAVYSRANRRSVVGSDDIRIPPGSGYGLPTAITLSPTIIA